MNATIPSGEQVRARLAGLSNSQLGEISAASGVPFTTLWKIRAGQTLNPGIDTVRKFAPFIPAECANHPAAQAAEQA